MTGKHILLFGAGKSSTALINYLLKTCVLNGWHLSVADSDLQLLQSKLGNAANASAISIKAEDEHQRGLLIRSADLVISLLPPALHIVVARDCLKYQKNLLTASYVDPAIDALGTDIKESNLLFLCEMGLDPGIDHMSAMQLIHRIKNKGGKITSFRSHCGGLTAPESDDNPWRYKISWNPRNIVLAGMAGATYKSKYSIVNVSYNNLFQSGGEITMGHLGKLAFYPNRDSLPYMKKYGLEDAATFIRTTLRYPEFNHAWNAIVHAGLTNDYDTRISSKLTFRTWSQRILPMVDDSNRTALEYLGLFDDELVPDNLQSSADILQFLLESKLMMKPSDKDMVVMLHEFVFELDGRAHHTNSLLIVEGEDNLNTAMAKTVGLPLGIAAKLILQNRISLTGLHIPVLPELYEPVLEALKEEGINFIEFEDDEIG